MLCLMCLNSVTTLNYNLNSEYPYSFLFPNIFIVIQIHSIKYNSEVLPLNFTQRFQKLSVKLDRIMIAVVDIDTYKSLSRLANKIDIDFLNKNEDH